MISSAPGSSGQTVSPVAAWARVRGVPVERVRGAFFHAATGETVWPELPGADEITAVLGAARRG